MTYRSKSRGALFLNLLGGFHAASPRAEDILILERKKTRALLAVLALESGRPISRGKLTTLLWQERSDDAARHALRQCLLDLRQALANVKVEALRSDGDLLVLEPSTVVIDVRLFQRHVTDGTPAALAEAVALYRGDLLDGFSLEEPAFEDWLHVERERLRSQAIGAMRRLLGHYMKEKDTDTAVEIGVRLVTLEPFDETTQRMLMRLYAESGRRSAALRQYEDCLEVLDRELHVEPELETRELYRRLLHDQARRANSVPAPIGTEPKPIPRVRAKVTLRSPTGPPLIGRDVDLEWLNDLRQRAHRGQPQLALIIGEAGVGKSRLVEEFAFCAQNRGAEILLGRGRDGEDVLPFAPWVEALRPLLSKELVARLRPVTRRDLARVLPELAEGSGPPPSGLEDGPRIFEAVAGLLREIAARHALVVLIEDLHWCDDMTVRLLRFLPRRLQGQPVVLIGTARVEEIAASSRSGPLLETLRNDASCDTRTLTPLSHERAMQLFRAVVATANDEASATLADRVWKLSEGNPFVIVACGRAARERDITAPGGSLQLPEQVRALTARCFANLGDGAARLAEIASVIGRDFEVAMLRHAGDLSEVGAADGIEELVRRRVLRQVDGRFDFTHDRVRELSYDSLLGPRRALLHRHVARALETVYASDLSSHFAAIGSHYRQAHVWDEACNYLGRAGFQAWTRGAGREALACFEDALQAIARLPDTDHWRELHVRLCLAANGAIMASGSYERGRSYLIQAEKLAGAVRSRRWEGRVATALSSSYRATGALDRALSFGERALTIARETEDRRLESEARYVLGMAENNVGSFRRSLDNLMTVLSVGTLEPDVDGPSLPYLDRVAGLRALVRYWMVYAYVQLGEFAAGMRLIEEWLRENEALEDSFELPGLTAYMSLGRIESAAGNFSSAIHAYEKARAIYRDDCHGNFYYPLSWGLALAYALGGRVAEGLELFERAQEVAQKAGTKAFQVMQLLHIGRALIEARRIDDAAQSAANALLVAREAKDGPAEAGAHGLLAEVARLREPIDREGTERHLLNALTLALALEMRPLAARCHLRLAWLYEQTGRPEQQHHDSAARSLLAQMGGPLKLDAAGVH